VRTRFTTSACVALVGFAMGGAIAHAAPGDKACPPDKVWSESQNGCVCAPNTSWDGNTRKCVPGNVPPPVLPKSSAAPSSSPSAPPPPPPPPSKDPKACPDGRQWSDPHNACVVICGGGKIPNAKGDQCVSPGAAPPAPTASSSAKQAPPPPPPPPPTTKPTTKQCPEGREWKEAFDACVPICPPDQVLDFHGIACHPIKLQRPRR
jgi:hypothetical protein